MNGALHERTEHGQVIDPWLSGSGGGTIEVNQIGHRGGNHLLGGLGTLQEMSFEHGCGFGQTMGQVPGHFKLTEGQCPAMLPVQREPTEHKNSGEHSDQTAVCSAVQTRQQGGLACNASCRE